MKLVLLLVMTGLLSSCVGERIKTQYYLLRSDLKPDYSREIKTSDIALTKLNVATYIDQPGLVLTQTSGEINIARYHQWAEPLRYSLKHFLANEIFAHSGRYINIGREKTSLSSTRLEVVIDQLHGTADGRVVLVAYWKAISKVEGKEIQLKYELTKTMPLIRDGYEALVASEKELLRNLAKEIAASL